MAIRPGQVVTSTGGGGGGGGSTTLANITGTLNTLKGGTGLNAIDLNDLRGKLGLHGTGGTDNDDLDYCADTEHQTRNTIQYFDGSTLNTPTGVTTGIVIKVGDDQVLINLDDGKRWIRSHTDSRGTWTSPVDAGSDLSEMTTMSEFFNMPTNGVGYTTTSAFLPSFTDGSKPAKVIVGRNSNYLICCDRNNMFWAPRPASASDTSISWNWEGNTRVPANLEYTGGEYDEEKIPEDESAILSGKTGVDGENFITMLVRHTAPVDDSIYTGFFVDDDSGKTLKKTTNTRGYTIGEWARAKVDADGIDDSIITIDRGSSDPVFHGIIPEISSLQFPGYTVKSSSSGMQAGDLYYNATSRTLYVVHQSTDTHLTDLFHPDFEVEIHKDASNYVRGVFSSVANVPGSNSITGAQFRAEDITSVGTITAGDTVEIRGHKSVVTKTDRILPVNLGLSHGATEANKIVGMNSTGDNFGFVDVDGLPSAVQIPSTAPTKSQSFTVTTSSPGDDEILITYSGTGGVVIDTTSASESTQLTSMASDCIANRKWLLIVKDANNYVAIRPSAATASSGLHTISENIISRIIRGTISANDSVRIWVRPDNASRHIVHDFLGESIVLEPERPHLIYARQTSGITSGFETGVEPTWLNFNTPVWKIPSGYKVGAHFEISASGVANFGSGTEHQIVPQLVLAMRSHSTVAGLSTNLSQWRTVNGVPGLPDQFFRSKVASGTDEANDDNNRDYWTFSSKPMPMRELHSDAVDDNYIIFRIGISKASQHNENLTNLYAFDTTIRIWPASMVTAS